MTMANSRYLWHYNLHRTVAAERLYFLSCEFNDSYDRGIAVDAVKVTFRKLGINSFVVWEMFGGIDLLIKVWVPATMEMQDITQELHESLPSPNRFRVTKFSVERTLFHWMWGGDVDPDARRKVHESHMVGLNAPTPPPQKSVREYLNAGLIARSRPSRTIKFFMQIRDGESRAEAPDFEQRVGERLKHVITGTSEVHSISLFQGEGFARYLISGRTAPQKYEAIAGELTNAINGLGLDLFRGMRTVTHFSSLSAPIYRREQLLAAPQAAGTQANSLDDLLRQEESSTLEFKASAFVDVGRAVQGNGKLVQDQGRQDDVIKTVTGLLNARGGVLAIGVAETEEFTRDEMHQVFPKVEEVGDYLVIGVEADYPRKGWDGYQRRLRTLFTNNISPDPTEWIDYARAEHEAGTVVLIQVRRPVRWYYAKSVRDSGPPRRFYARIGNETIPLEGQRMDEYRERNPRTTS